MAENDLLLDASCFLPMMDPNSAERVIISSEDVNNLNQDLLIDAIMNDTSNNLTNHPPNAMETSSLENSLRFPMDPAVDPLAPDTDPLALDTDPLAPSSEPLESIIQNLDPVAVNINVLQKPQKVEITPPEESGNDVESPTTGNEFVFKCAFCDQVLSSTDEPKLLECLHNACSVCINLKMYDQHDASGQMQIQIQCPICAVFCDTNKFIENQFLLEASNVEDPNTSKNSDLKCSSCSDDASATSYCTDCSEFICDSCVQAHQRLKITKDHTIKPKEDGLSEINSASNTISTLFCTNHPHEKLSLFCESCDKLTCRDCQLLEHREHKYKFTTEIASETRKYIAEMLKDVGYKRVLLTSAMKVIEDRQNLITDKKQGLVREITQLVVKLTNTINVRGKQLVAKLSEVCDSKQKTLQEKKEALEQLSRMTDHCIEFTQHALERGSDMALLYSKKQVTEHLKRIKCKRADIPNPEIPVRIHLALDKVPELIKAMSTIGQIVVDGRVYPSQDSPSPQPPPHSSVSPGVSRTPQQSPSPISPHHPQINPPNFQASRMLAPAPPYNQYGNNNQQYQGLNMNQNLNQIMASNMNSNMNQNQTQTMNQNQNMSQNQNMNMNQNQSMNSAMGQGMNLNNMNQSNIGPNMSPNMSQNNMGSNMNQNNMNQNNMNLNQQHQQQSNIVARLTNNMGPPNMNMNQSHAAMTLQQINLNRLGVRSPQGQQRALLRLPNSMGINQVSSSTHPMMQDRSNLRHLLQPNNNQSNPSAVYVRTGPDQYQAVTPHLAQQFQRFPNHQHMQQQVQFRAQNQNNQMRMLMNNNVQNRMQQPSLQQRLGFQMQPGQQSQQGNGPQVTNQQTTAPPGNSPGLKWHTPQQGANNTLGNGMANARSMGLPSINDNFKITLKPQQQHQQQQQQQQPACTENKNLPSTVTSTNPKTPSPHQGRSDAERKMDKFCEDSVNDLMATIAKLDSNGVQVLAEGRQKGGSPHVDSSTGDTTGAPPPALRKIKSEPETSKDDPNEDWCAVCMDGGELVCCDKCPKVFHQYCHIPNLSVEENDTWQCLLCMNFADIPQNIMGEKKEGELSIKERKIAERLVLELYCQYDLSLPFREVLGPEHTAYYEIIKNPIALDRIRKKLNWESEEHYTTTESLIRDIRQMFKNAYIFNPEDTQIFKYAKRLEKFFDDQLEKFLPEYAYERFDDDDLNPPPNKKYRKIVTQ